MIITLPIEPVSQKAYRSHCRVLIVPAFIGIPHNWGLGTDDKHQSVFARKKALACCSFARSRSATDYFFPGFIFGVKELLLLLAKHGSGEALLATALTGFTWSSVWLVVDTSGTQKELSIRQGRMMLDLESPYWYPEHISHNTTILRKSILASCRVVVVDDSHIQRIVLATEETTVTQQVSH